MDIDKLTIGEIKQLERFFSVGRSKAPVAPEQKRVVLVVDRGWIFAGDLSATSDGYLRLDRAVHVFRWESLGFAKMLKEWRSDKVDLRASEPVEIPADAVIFRVPVADDWGVK